MWQTMVAGFGSAARSASGSAATIASARSCEQRQANESGVVRFSSAPLSPSSPRIRREETKIDLRSWSWQQTRSPAASGRSSTSTPRADATTQSSPTSASTRIVARRCSEPAR